MNRKLTSEFIYWLTHWTYKIYKVWCFILPSVLWRCWLGGRKGIRPVKTEWWGAGVVICTERGADLHMAQLMPLPLTISCFSIIQNSFYLSGTGSPGWSRTGPLNVCVCGAFYYSSADPIDGARGIMFWGCLSWCMCDVLICLTRQRHPQPSLLSTSSIQPSYCISYFSCNNTANAAACNVLLSSPGVVCR